MPFTRDEFLDVFGAYNTALWPAAIALWILSLTLVVLAVARPGRTADRVISGLLALHWAWSALAYHASFFTRINPAAWIFAALFLAQAGLFLWLGAFRGHLRLPAAPGRRHLLAGLLVVYAFVYPLIVMAGGLVPPRAPTFGVPCPTVILTIGLLTAADRPPWALAVVPLLWALIGGSAALLFGVRADLVLLAAVPLFLALRIACGRQLRHAPAV